VLTNTRKTRFPPQENGFSVFKNLKIRLNFT
jgi:hypothetical protein